jgi:hypothetical protein
MSYRKLHVMVARRRAERIGPTVIVAPQRGHAHVVDGHAGCLDLLETPGGILVQ